MDLVFALRYSVASIHHKCFYCLPLARCLFSVLLLGVSWSDRRSWDHLGRLHSRSGHTSPCYIRCLYQSFQTTNLEAVFNKRLKRYFLVLDFVNVTIDRPWRLFACSTGFGEFAHENLLTVVSLGLWETEHWLRFLY